jgi:hypothetical protein
MTRLAASVHVLLAISLLSLTSLAQPQKESTPQLAVQFDSGSGRVFEMPVFKDGGGSSSNFKQIDSWKPAKGHQLREKSLLDFRRSTRG